MKAFGNFGFVMGQIDEAVIDAAAEAGVTAIVQNRPDNEEAGQASSESLQDYAAQKGISYHLAPMVAGSISPESVAIMQQVAAETDGKILAFCKVGGRASAMLAIGLTAAKKADSDTVITAAMEAGFDISGLKPMLDQA